jgi:2-polyprenyl-3-methyl-5-hydroxy-6-metoxy-1,4-benzoquinol methylase
MEDHYKKNLDFWETAWSRVKNPVIHPPAVDYIADIPAILSEYNVQSILDIACGSGWLSFYLGDKGFDCTGIDISPSAIKLASTVLSEKYPNSKIKFQTADMMEIDKVFSKNSFDAIAVNAVFEHLNYERGAIFLRKLYEVVKHKGIIFAVFDEVAQGDKGTFITLKDGTRQYTDSMREGMMLRNYSDEELKSLLESAGWQIRTWRTNEQGSRIVVAQKWVKQN